MILYIERVCLQSQMSVFIIIINVEKCLFIFTEERKIVCLPVYATLSPPITDLLQFACSRYLTLLPLHHSTVKIYS